MYVSIYTANWTEHFILEHGTSNTSYWLGSGVNTNKLKSSKTFILPIHSHPQLSRTSSRRKGRSKQSARKVHVQHILCTLHCINTLPIESRLESSSSTTYTAIQPLTIHTHTHRHTAPAQYNQIEEQKNKEVLREVLPWISLMNLTYISSVVIFVENMLLQRTHNKQSRIEKTSKPSRVGRVKKVKEMKEETRWTMIEEIRKSKRWSRERTWTRKQH